MTRRVVVTGIGLVSPLGSTPDEVFSAVMARRSATEYWPSGEIDRPAVVARAPFEAERWFTRLQLPGIDRVSQLAVAAAESARLDAGLSHLDDNTGIYVGSGMGGAAALDRAYQSHHRTGKVPPLTIPAFMCNAPAAHVAMRFQLHGPAFTYSIACASSAVAIAEGANAIARGSVESALVGGSEALLVPGVVHAWQALQTLATPDPAQAATASRPFATDRSGLVLGEGAAFLLLEPREAAEARGARIYAELAGSGVSCDATHLTKPDAAGQVRAIQAALRASGLEPTDIGYCNAHGTATLVGDVVESEALNRVWGDRIGDLPVNSTKALHGHLLGAAGALEAAITVMALHHRSLPPSAHVTAQDPACAIRLVADGETPARDLQAAMSNSFAFGGTNAVLIFRHPG